jgi:hypothetical protein
LLGQQAWLNNRRSISDGQYYSGSRFKR